MALPAVLAGIAAAGSIVSTAASFFDAQAKEKAARANFEDQMRNIQEQYTRGRDQINTMMRQGRGFIGSQKVAAATTGVSGSVSAAVAVSQGYLLRDRDRAQRQLDLDMRAAQQQARNNLAANLTSATNQRLGAVGSLLSNAASLGIQGYNAGLFGERGKKSGS